MKKLRVTVIDIVARSRRNQLFSRLVQSNTASIGHAPQAVAIGRGPYHSPNLDRYATRNRIYRWHISAFHDEVHDLVRAAAPVTLLDAGCGEGFLATLIAHRDPHIDITAVDFAPGAIEYARAGFGKVARFEVADVLALPFADKSFDLVLCSQVLEHLDDPFAAVRELVRVSRRHVLITVPREPVFRLLNDLGQALGLCGDPEHVQFWSKRHFQAEFAPFFREARFCWKHTYQLVLGRVR